MLSSNAFIYCLTYMHVDLKIDKFSCIFEMGTHGL